MDIISKFNPDNFARLTPEDITEMQGLTIDQMSQLAEAYPNKPINNSYLILYNTKESVHKQLYPLSSWANILQLHKLGRTEYVPYNFAKVFSRPTEISADNKKVVTRIVDLADGEEVEGVKAKLTIHTPVKKPAKPKKKKTIPAAKKITSPKIKK